ncbi:DMT family transporter [Chachezhania sediminis]|uniref:DMT family transporter n=1 Tax=Chachezhania sediminis TaxID=2599291 RepID=UPI00131D79E9|nr:multidrug efflux SMR transporter [Chachezhania sediminis]
MHYVFLAIAIVSEVIGTTALKASNEMTRLMPAIVVVVSYTISFYSMSFAFRTMQIGIVYAIWSGAGIVLIAGMGYFVYGQKLDLAAQIGLSLIVAGIVVINLFSKAGTH